MYPTNFDNYSTFADNVRDQYDYSSIDTESLPVSNLSVDGTKNQLTNLYLPVKHKMLSYLDPQDFGPIALVNKSFNEAVFPKDGEIQINPFPNYRGFLSYSLIKECLNQQLPAKLLSNMQNNLSGMIPGIDLIDSEYLTVIYQKTNAFCAPIISEMSNIYALALFQKKDVSNKDLLQMINLSKNPIFNKMFNLAGEIAIDTLPTVIHAVNDADLFGKAAAFEGEISADIEEAIQKTKANLLQRKEEKVSRLADLHSELKRQVAEVDPIPDLVVPGPMALVAPVVPLVVPVGGPADIFSNIRDAVFNTAKNVVDLTINNPINVGREVAGFLINGELPVSATLVSCYFTWLFVHASYGLEMAYSKNSTNTSGI